MDKLLGHMQRDIKFRKVNKKIQYPIPKINPRLAPPGSAQEICTMKDGLKDESKNIMQIAFLPEPEEGASGGPRMIMPGEDIPNAPGRCRDEERRSNLSVNINNGPTQGTQPRYTDRADRTVNFQDREQHRTNIISEVQQNLMNISNSRNIRIRRTTQTFALIAQITQNTKIKTHGHEMLITAGIINPAIPVTQTP